MVYVSYDLNRQKLKTWTNLLCTNYFLTLFVFAFFAIVFVILLICWPYIQPDKALNNTLLIEPEQIHLSLGGQLVIYCEPFYLKYITLINYRKPPTSSDHLDYPSKHLKILSLVWH